MSTAAHRQQTRLCSSAHLFCCVPFCPAYTLSLALLFKKGMGNLVAISSRGLARILSACYHFPHPAQVVTMEQSCPFSIDSGVDQVPSLLGDGLLTTPIRVVLSSRSRRYSCRLLQLCPLFSRRTFSKDASTSRSYCPRLFRSTGLHQRRGARNISISSRVSSRVRNDLMWVLAPLL